jgi:hypothetical protein
MKNKKVYICGQVTGLDYFMCVSAFLKRESELLRLGYSPVNPMKLVKHGTPWNEAMRICIPAMLECDNISPLPNTLYSEGGLLEWQLARKLELTILIP